MSIRQYPIAGSQHGRESTHTIIRYTQLEFLGLCMHLIACATASNLLMLHVCCTQSALLPALSSLEDFFINKLHSGEVVPTLKAAEAQGSANGKW